MRKWNCDVIDIRMACFEAKKIQKIGKRGKFEIYTTIKGREVKSIINVYYEDEIFIITGAEGHE